MAHLAHALHCMLLQFRHCQEKQDLPSSFASCNLRKTPPPFSNVAFPQCNRNKALFLGYRCIPRAPRWPDTNISRPCKWGCSTICSCAFGVSGPCHSASFCKTCTTTSHVNTILVHIHTNYSQELVK